MEKNKAYSSRWAAKVDIGEGERDVERWWWQWLVLHMIWEKEEKTMDKNTVEMWWWWGTQKQIQKKEKEVEENQAQRQCLKNLKKTRLRDVAWVYTLCDVG